MPRDEMPIGTIAERGSRDGLVSLKLSAPSRTFADRLFARFPEWAQLAACDDSGGLLVNVPSPTGSPERTLGFWMNQGDEPSVEYGRCHTHDGLWPAVEDLLDFVSEVLRDEQLFIVVRRRRLRVLDGCRFGRPRRRDLGCTDAPTGAARGTRPVLDGEQRPRCSPAACCRLRTVSTGQRRGPDAQA